MCLYRYLSLLLVSEEAPRSVSVVEYGREAVSFEYLLEIFLHLHKPDYPYMDYFTHLHIHVHIHKTR